MKDKVKRASKRSNSKHDTIQQRSVCFILTPWFMYLKIHSDPESNARSKKNAPVAMARANVDVRRNIVW